MIACTKCCVDKPLGQFYLMASGRRRRDCIDCVSVYAKARPAYQYEPDAEKACARCLVTKKNTEFSRNKNSKLGTRSWCKACFKIYADRDNKMRYAASRERELRRTAEWATRNHEHVLARSRQRRAINPAPAIATANRRRARKLMAKGRGVTAEDWQQILELHDRRCAYCLEKSQALEMDHVIALARGGDHDPDNIVPACTSCNSSKNDKSLLEIFNPRLVVAQRMAS